MTQRRRPPPVAAQRGAALLIAMLILSLVAVAAAAMVQHQQRAIEVEAAERARVQAAWLLNGAIDWARLILREDRRTGTIDHEGEPWATQLAESRLSTFLAAQGGSTDIDPDLDAFFSGRLTDLQSRYNLTRLAADDGKSVEVERAALRRLCEAAGLSADVADRLGTGMVSAMDGGTTDGPLRPRRLSQLAWLGLDARALAALQPLVVILPVRTPVNVNTASREVLLAAIDGIDLGVAERIVQARQRTPFDSVAKVREFLGAEVKVDEGRVSVGSSFFLAQARVRLGDRALEEHAVIERRTGGEVLVRRRERVNAYAPG